MQINHRFSNPNWHEISFITCTQNIAVLKIYVWCKKNLCCHFNSRCESPATQRLACHKIPLHRHGRDERGPVLCGTLPDAKQAPTRGLLRAECEDLAHDPLHSPPTTWTRTSLDWEGDQGPLAFPFFLVIMIPFGYCLKFVLAEMELDLVSQVMEVVKVEIISFASPSSTASKRAKTCPEWSLTTKRRISMQLSPIVQYTQVPGGWYPLLYK